MRADFVFVELAESGHTVALACVFLFCRSPFLPASAAYPRAHHRPTGIKTPNAFSSHGISPARVKSLFFAVFPTLGAFLVHSLMRAIELSAILEPRLSGYDVYSKACVHIKGKVWALLPCVVRRHEFHWGRTRIKSCR